MEDKKDDDITIDFGKMWGSLKSHAKLSAEPEDKKGANPAQSESGSKDANSNAETSKKKDADYINLDFSKIRKFFKSDEREGEKLHAAENRQNEDEVILNFSGFKKKVSEAFTADKGKEQRDETVIDIKSIIPFFKKYAWLFAVIIPIVLSIYIRMQSANLPIIDQWAANTVINSARSQIQSQIDAQYPNLPQANKNTILESELQKFLVQNKAQVEQQMAGTSSYLKSFFQDESGKIYMPDIDPYYWYRYAKNIIEKGYPGDEVRDGVQWDNHQEAPLGRPIQADMFHSYFLAYLYKALHIFNSGITLMSSTMYYPVLVSALAVLLAFLIGRKVCGNVGGFFSALMMAVNSSFMGRTLFGHADSDAWIVLFSLLIAWLTLEFFESKNKLTGIALAVAAGFLAGVFSITWSGWFFITEFIFGVAGVNILYHAIQEIRKEGRINFSKIISNSQIKNMVLLAAVFFVSVGAFVTLFNNFNAFRSSLLPFSFITIKEPVRFGSLWPNVLTTVAELNEGSYNQVINSIGGRFLWYVGLLGVLLTLLKKNHDGKTDIKYFVLLSVWIAASVYASLKGIRFTILISPAFSIAFGSALGFAYLYFSKWLNKELHIHRGISGTVLIVVFTLPYISAINASIDAAGGDIPLINDAWYNSLIKIKENSNPNAIITSWWDFGHHFKALADRPVTFDGTTQEKPDAHWVGRLFMTSDEAEAIGILRMIDCGQNNAYWTLLKEKGQDIHSSINTVRRIILMDKESARRELIRIGVSEDKAEEILKSSHCTPPEAFAIASDDMIGKSGVWGHFGSWNFERADIWFNTKDKAIDDAVQYMQDKFNYTRERAESIYFEIQSLSTPSDANAWIAPWPGYGGTIKCSRKSLNESLLQCDNSFQINLTNMDAFALGQQGIVRPKLFAYPSEKGINIKEFGSNTVGLGFTLVPKSQNEFEVVLSSPELAGSMFTRMFYMNGYGLKYFKQFSNERGYTGTNVYVYKVDWEGKNMTLSNDYLNYMKVGDELPDK